MVTMRSALELDHGNSMWAIKEGVNRLIAIDKHYGSITWKQVKKSRKEHQCENGCTISIDSFYYKYNQKAEGHRYIEIPENPHYTEYINLCWWCVKDIVYHRKVWELPMVDYNYWKHNVGPLCIQGKELEDLESDGFNDKISMYSTRYGNNIYNRYMELQERLKFVENEIEIINPEFFNPESK